MGVLKNPAAQQNIPHQSHQNPFNALTALVDYASTGCPSLFIYSSDPPQKSVKSIQGISDTKGDIWVLDLYLCSSSDLRDSINPSQPGIPCSVELCCGAFSGLTLGAIVYFPATGRQEETPFFPANEGCQD